MKPEQKKTLLNYTPYKSDLKGWKKQKAISIKSKTNIKWHLKYKQRKKKKTSTKIVQGNKLIWFNFSGNKT